MSGFALKFEVTKNGELVKESTLSQEVIKIGRMASSHLQIDDEGVSKMHAVVEIGGDGDAHIIDLGSDSGTMVNGTKVNKSVIKDGDVIALGNVEIKVVFMREEEQAAAAPPAPPAAESMPSRSSIPPGAVVRIKGQRVSSPVGLGKRVQVDSPVSPSVPPPTLDLNTVEDVSQQATEVVVMWNGSVLLVKHYSPGEKKPENFYIGEDPTCHFPIPVEALKGQTKVPLVVNEPGAAALVNILPGVEGDITYDDGKRMSIEELVSSGQARASADFPGAQCINLPTKSRIKMDVDSWTFLVNSVAKPRKFIAPLEFDWSSQIYTGISLVMHFVFLFLIYFIPPSPEGLSLDLLDDSNRFIKYCLNPPEVEQEEVEWLQKKANDKKQGGKGKRHKGDEGQMGKRDSKKTDSHYGIKGPKDNPNPHMAREAMKDMAKNAGILSFMSAANAPTSPFGQDTALGVDPENALGALMGNQVGANFGYGGLGLAGTGRGGGGTGEGTIGLGNLNTIGHGGGGGSGSGYGRGAGGLSGRRTKAPQIRSGSAMVKGSLSKDIIRRIVHRHINEVKFCYERQLAKRPDLSGRVSIKFIISGTGAVQMSAVAASTVGDPQVENCIAQAVRRWTFPQPEGGGIVIVTYPFMLTSPEGD
jgi:hypothetical protein